MLDDSLPLLFTEIICKTKEYCPFIQLTNTTFPLVFEINDLDFLHIKEVNRKITDR